MLDTLGYILAYSSFIFWIWIVVDAFKMSVFHGVACLVFWPYFIYYLAVHFEHDRKGWIILGYVGLPVIGGLLMLAG